MLGVLSKGRRARPPGLAHSDGEASYNKRESLAVQAPCDTHYVATLAVLDHQSETGHQGRSRLYYVGTTTALVLLQLVVLWTIILTTGGLRGVCLWSDECGRGKFCTASVHPTLGRRTGRATGQCLECDQAPFVCDPALNAPNVPGVLSYVNGVDALESMSALPGTTLTMTDVTEMCDRCLVRGTFVVSELPRNISVSNVITVPELNLHGMDMKSWAVLLLVTIAAVAAVNNEETARIKTVWLLHTYLHTGLSDTNENLRPSKRYKSKKLGLYSVRCQLSDESTPSGVSGDAPNAQGTDRTQHRSDMCGIFVRQVMLMLQALRGVVLTTAVAVVPTLIIFNFSDPVSIVLDAIAALFILEIDDMLLRVMHSGAFVESVEEDRVCIDRVIVRVHESYKTLTLIATVMVLFMWPLVASLSGALPINGYYPAICGMMIALPLMCTEIRTCSLTSEGQGKWKVCWLRFWRAVFVVCRWLAASGISYATAMLVTAVW